MDYGGFYVEFYNLITNCPNIATSLLIIATSSVKTKDVAMLAKNVTVLAKDVARLGRTLLDVKSLLRLKSKVHLVLNKNVFVKVVAHFVITILYFLSFNISPSKGAQGTSKKEKHSFHRY